MQESSRTPAQPNHRQALLQIRVGAGSVTLEHLIVAADAQEGGREGQSGNPSADWPQLWDHLD